MPTDACNEELEALTAIFLEDLQIKEETEGTSVMSMILYPATAGDEELRYVTLTLEITLVEDYPDNLPKLLIRNPRGLSDASLYDLQKRMASKCEELRGCQMIYELIEMTKEFLTSNNRPASECPICLLSFTQADVFYRSHCFHHFHSHCLGKYLQSLLDAHSAKLEEPMTPNGRRNSDPSLLVAELICPVCREELKGDVDVLKLLDSPPPSEESSPTSVSDESTALLCEWKSQRDSLNKLFEKQKNQGGIICLDEMEPKSLIISAPIPEQVSTIAGSTEALTLVAPPIPVPKLSVPKISQRVHTVHTQHKCGTKNGSCSSDSDNWHSQKLEKSRERDSEAHSSQAPQPLTDKLVTPPTPPRMYANGVHSRRRRHDGNRRNRHK